MNKEWAKEQLGIKLIHILSKLIKGRYELEYDTEKNRYELVVYNIANYGVYSAIYIPQHNNIPAALNRLQETIEWINKH